MIIPFNQPTYVEKGIGYITEAILKYRRLNGDGVFTAKCTQWLEQRFGTKVLLTTSCTHALEMASLLADIKPGDEVIMPAFTFVSTADAFVLRGARIKFVDIRKDTMNIDERKIMNPASNTNIMQNLLLENRNKLNISGVLDVLSFDDQIVIVETELGLLTVKGDNLRINKLSIDTSEVIVEGDIISLIYSQKELDKKGEGFLSKIFK